MLPCCENLAKPVISTGQDGLTLNAVYSDYPGDFLELKGEFSKDIFENGLLHEYMRYACHRESCVKQVPLTQLVIQSILCNINNKLFALYLCVLELTPDVEFSVVQRKS